MDSESEDPMVVEARCETARRDFVDVGYHNWVTIRNEWNKKAPGHKPKPKRKINYEKVFEEAQKEQPGPAFSERVPLSDFLQVMVEIWESEGII